MNRADGDCAHIPVVCAFIFSFLAGDLGHLEIRAVIVRGEFGVFLKGFISAVCLRGCEIAQAKVIARYDVIGFDFNGF